MQFTVWLTQHTAQHVERESVEVYFPLLKRRGLSQTNEQEEYNAEIQSLQDLDAKIKTHEKHLRADAEEYRKLQGKPARLFQDDVNNPPPPTSGLVNPHPGMESVAFPLEAKKVVSLHVGCKICTIHGSRPRNARGNSRRGNSRAFRGRDLFTLEKEVTWD